MLICWLILMCYNSSISNNMPKAMTKIENPIEMRAESANE